VGKKVKRSKSPPRQVAGGGKRSAPATSPKRGQGSRKILSRKRAEIPDEVRRVLDAPALDIAGLDNPALYVEQCCFVISWFRKMFERVGSHNKKLAREARVALETLWRDGLSELTALALDKERKAEEWAERLLAITGYWIASDDEKLRKANEAYRQVQSELRKSKFWRPDPGFQRPKRPRSTKRFTANSGVLGFTAENSFCRRLSCMCKVCQRQRGRCQQNISLS
jgi:hypothetical protein